MLWNGLAVVSHLYTTEHVRCCDKGKGVHVHTMKMCWGRSGIDPLVFTDIVLKCGLPVACTKNEPFQDFFKLTLDAPIASDNVLIERVIMNTFLGFIPGRAKRSFLFSKIPH
jgi:hypothetical protein